MDREATQVKALMEENERLRVENAKLKAELEPRHENGIVYFGNNPQPFCGTCFGNVPTKRIPLIAHRELTVFTCKVCHATPPRPGAVAYDSGAYPLQPGDDILKGGNHTVIELPLDWENPNK